MKHKRKLADIFQKITIPYKADGSVDYDACFEYTGTFRKRSPYWDFEGKKLVAYLVVWKLVKGEPFPEGMIALHSCDNRRCCNVWRHITPGTHKQNMEDMEVRDRHGMPAHAVRYILKLLERGDTHESIAEKFGCSRETVTKINNGHVHKRHLNPEKPARDENSIEVLEFVDPSARKGKPEGAEG